jgi:hypothetical protein
MASQVRAGVRRPQGSILRAGTGGSPFAFDANFLVNRVANNGSRQFHPARIVLCAVENQRPLVGDVEVASAIETPLERGVGPHETFSRAGLMGHRGQTSKGDPGVGSFIHAIPLDGDRVLCLWSEMQGRPPQARHCLEVIGESASRGERD